MTDDGSAYRSNLFATAPQQAQVRHIRNRPYTPRTNGNAERFIQTSLREWAYARPCSSFGWPTASEGVDRQLGVFPQRRYCDYM
jgi:transposase InsO family protein